MFGVFQGQWGNGAERVREDVQAGVNVSASFFHPAKHKPAASKPPDGMHASHG